MGEKQKPPSSPEEKYLTGQQDEQDIRGGKRSYGKVIILRDHRYVQKSQMGYRR